jgi:hypothetical protein
MVIRGTLGTLVPVLMTALAAGIALIPLVLAADQPGKEILHPVAVVIVGGLIVSSGALPAGNDFPTVVQIKATPNAKTVTEKFNLNLTKCPTCSNAEYACTCEH